MVATICGVMHLLATDKYTDVTDKFRQDAKSLAPGQIVNTPDFTLYKAISAFELGNPKMDTGLEFKVFEEESKSIKYPQSPQEICSAIDLLLCREVSWLTGSTLVQTVFSGLFVERELQRLKDPKLLHSEYLKTIDVSADLLRVYVLATLKSCGLVVDSMLLDDAGVVALEEDFHVNTAGWSLLEEVNLDLVTDLLDKAIAHCGSTPDLQELKIRFQFRREMLNIYYERITTNHSHINKALELLKQWQDKGDNVQKNGAEEKTVEVKPETLDANVPHSPLFGTGVQARSDWFCLQRPLTTVATLTEAKQYHASLLEGIRDASNILKLTKSSDFLGFLLNFAKENHTPVLRIMVKNVFSQHSLLGFSPQAWVEKDISELSFPAFASYKQQIIQKCRPEWDAFMMQAPLCYIDLLTCLCVNRCRQRKLMFDSAATWDSLQVAAQALDRAIVQAGIGSTILNEDGVKSWALEFSSWVYHRKLQVMLWSFLMGFEQDLFSAWESAAMYWYAKHVAGILVGQLMRLKSYFQENNYRQSAGYQYIVAMEVEARCLEHLCVANWLMYLVFEGRGLVKRPPTSYSSPELTFGLRLECFESIGIPALPKYEEFSKESELYGGSENLALKTVKANISGAQAFLKAISQVAGPNHEIQKLKRSAFGLSAMVLKLGKGVDKIKFVKEGNHPYFPVPTSC